MNSDVYLLVIYLETIGKICFGSNSKSKLNIYTIVQIKF